MTKRTQALLAVLAMVTVALAGCTSSDTTDAPAGAATDDAPASLGGKGAINGLVVDDNFRPVQLKEDWGANGPGEFQDLGFVLILETGQRFETNENGEFQARPLEPGSYTLRVAADNHEAVDTAVQVVAGEFTEITLEARRTFSTGGTTISQEEVLFISCTVATSGVRLALAAVENNGCGDLSGDSSRFDFFTDYTSLSDDIRGMVTELRANQDGYWGVTIRTFETETCECEFADFEVWNGKYGKNILYPDKAMRREGRESEGTDTYTYVEEGEDESWRQPGHEDTSGSGFWAMTFDYQFQTALFADHPSRQYTSEALNPVGCGAPEVPNPVLVDNFIEVLFCDAWGNGVILGVKAQFLQTVYLYELPEEGIEDFCALCADADIPE